MVYIYNTSLLRIYLSPDLRVVPTPQLPWLMQGCPQECRHLLPNTDSVSFASTARMGLPGGLPDLFSIFEETSTLSSTPAVPFTFPPTV